MTIKDRLCEGLEALGHRRVIEYRTRRYDVFRRPDGKLWYVGKSGALRIGTTIDNSAKATDQLRDYVFAAATVRPVITTYLTEKPPENGGSLEVLMHRLIRDNPDLKAFEFRTIRQHVQQMLREKRISYVVGTKT